MPTRDDAYVLMTAHVKNENLQKHMLSVEAAMRFYARKYAQDEELWAMTGLLHDCDYEEYPDLQEHTQIAAQWLRDGGYDDRIIYAILAHNDLNQATYPRNDLLSKALCLR
ncbi:MAG TPA: HDIG domain-containing protein [Ktedonobacteraceae bacterium]|jgi:putative nucleotidyltransferase with HDIG domain